MHEHAFYLCGCKRSNALEMLPSTVSKSCDNHPPSLLKPIAIIAVNDSFTRASKERKHMNFIKISIKLRVKISKSKIILKKMTHSNRKTNLDAMALVVVFWLIYRQYQWCPFVPFLQFVVERLVFLLVFQH